MHNIYKTKKPSVPRDANQWAEDAYKALEKALIAFDEDYPSPSDEERIELIGYAAEIAAQARGIKDDKRIDAADEYAVDNVLADLDGELDGESETDDDSFEDEPAEPQYNILFLLCYLDVHVSFGLLKERELESIMDNLLDNYELTMS